MNKPIFILGAHKSGTSLLRSLLDDHNELSIIPIEEHLFKHLGYQIDYPYQHQEKQNYSEERMKDNFVEWISICNNSNDKYADSVATDIFDLKLFTEEINSKSNLSETELSKLYFDSILKSTGKFKSDGRIVSKSVENSEFALDLKRLFPESKFLHIVRNPYAAFVALRKYKTKHSNYPLVDKLLKALYNDYYHLERNKRLLGEDYHIIRYEDLVTESERSLRDVASFLNIDYSDSLHNPSFLGNPWSGNSTSNIKMTGLDYSRLNSFKKELFSYEIILINNSFSSFLKNYNYEQLKPKKGKYKRMKGEGFVKYLLNRMYSYFRF